MIAALLIVIGTPIVYVWFRFTLDSDWSALLALGAATAYVYTISSIFS